MQLDEMSQSSVAATDFGAAAPCTHLPLGKLDAHGKHVPLALQHSRVNVLAAHAAADTGGWQGRRLLSEQAAMIAGHANERAAGGTHYGCACGAGNRLSPLHARLCRPAGAFRRMPGGWWLDGVPVKGQPHRNSAAFVGLAIACTCMAPAAGRAGRRAAAAANGCRATQALLLSAVALLLAAMSAAIVAAALETSCGAVWLL